MRSINWLKATLYFLIAFLAPVTDRLAISAEKQEWPTAIGLIAMLSASLLAGLTALKAYTSDPKPPAP